MFPTIKWKVTAKQALNYGHCFYFRSFILLPHITTWTYLALIYGSDWQGSLLFFHYARTMHYKIKSPLPHPSHQQKPPWSSLLCQMITSMHQVHWHPSQRYQSWASWWIRKSFLLLGQNLPSLHHLHNPRRCQLSMLLSIRRFGTKRHVATCSHVTPLPGKLVKDVSTG